MGRRNRHCATHEGGIESKGGYCDKWGHEDGVIPGPCLLVNDDRHIAGVREYQLADAARADRWVPACGGTEVPIQYRSGRYLYVFNFALREHAYLNVETDTLEDLPR